jgi:hypothetical protein
MFHVEQSSLAAVEQKISTPRSLNPRAGCRLTLLSTGFSTGRLPSAQASRIAIPPLAP